MLEQTERYSRAAFMQCEANASKSEYNHILIVVCGAVFFASLMVWSQVSNWNQVVSESEIRLIETAHSIVDHTNDVFSLVQSPLQQLGAMAEADLASDRDPIRLVNHLRSQFGSYRPIRSIAYADRSGALVGSTLIPDTSGMNIRDREYFHFHQSSPSVRPRMGVPSQSQTDGRWFLPITQRVNKPDGTFGGVMVATIDIEHFVSFMKNYDIGSDSSFLLMRDDGNVLIRLPIDPSAMRSTLSSSDFFRKEVLPKGKGSYEYNSTFDGVRRISGYFRDPETGITASAARSKRTMLCNWIRTLALPWLCLAMTYIAALLLAFHWLRQSKLRARSERIVTAREAELRLIAKTSADVIEKIDRTGIRHFVSLAAERLYEQHPESLLGTSIIDSGSSRDVWLNALERLEKGSGSETITWTRDTQSGTSVWLESAISAMAIDDGVPHEFVVITRDVTQREIRKNELKRIAITDELTGLFNKRHFSNVLNTSMADRDDYPIAVFMIDLDRFKLYNDMYGHMAGNRCLQTVAAAIKNAVSDDRAIVSRFGGEEISIIVLRCDELHAVAIAERIRGNVESLSITHEKNDPFGCVTISLGYAVYHAKGSLCEDEIINAADRRLYMAKKSGRNRYIGTCDAMEPV